MMKRLKKAIATSILMIVSILCLTLAACGSDDVTLQFDTNGGEPVAAITVSAGEEVDLPVPAVREGYDFIGWFENADGTGEAVTKVVAQTDKTYYAKWEKLYKITFELGKGKMDASSCYLKAGTYILDSIRDYIPTLDGCLFGEWTLNGNAVSSGTAMPENDITLTARYKVGYTVHVYLQKTTLDGYEAGEDIKGYDYPAASYTPAVEMKGFEITEYNDETTRTLSEDVAQNVFTFRFDRKHYSAILFPNYPDGTDSGGETVSIDFVYGETVELPYTRFKADGYLLKGWSDIASGTFYRSQVLDGLLRNGDGVARKDSFVLEADEQTEIMLYAEWEQGYRDLLGGEDIIFHSEEEAERVILLRYDDYYEGTFLTVNGGLFRFSLENGTLLLEGKFFEGNKTFAYYDEAREGRVYHRYQVGLGILSSERISLDSYNGLTYTQTLTYLTGTEDRVSTGTYYMDEDGYCVATYTSGDKEGTTETMILAIATANGVSQRVFELRVEEDVDRGTMYRYEVVDGNVVYYPSAYLLTLDGFGNAAMQSGTSVTNYYYVVSGEILQLLTSSGSVYGTYRFVQFESGKGYMTYNASLNRAFTNDSDTLTLDGACNAEYTHAGSTVKGYYSAINSNFGGVIITMVAEGETHVFRAYTRAGDGDTTLFVFEEKDAGYAEYLYVYQNDQGTYRSAAPLLVIDNEKEGLASLYGYTETGAYVKVAEGKITSNEKDGTQEKFLFTVTQHIRPETEPRTEPYDLSKIESFVYSTGVASNYSVAYWYSVTMTGEESSTFDEQFSSDMSGEKLTLVSGFAVYSRAGEETVAGVYSVMSTNENVIRMTVNNTTYYFELNKESKTFIHLDNLYGTKVERLSSGLSDSNVTLFLDGKGGATLTTTPQDGEPTIVQGRYEEGTETAFGARTYRFIVAGDDSKSFDFILLSSTLTTYFTRSTGAKTYTAADGARLELDGYSYSARYIDAKENVSTGRYTISEDAVTFTFDDRTYYFDLEGNDTFTVRGSEAGQYLRFENQYMDGTVYVFDGHTHLTVQRLAEGAEQPEEVATGTYEPNGDGWLLKYTIGGVEYKIKGRTGVYLISSTSGYRVFRIEQEEIEHKYINEADWSVLVPDGHGEATLYTASGVVESGTYLIIEDSETEHLLYYANSAGTDACLYRFDSQKGTIEKISSGKQYGYYTTDLRSLRFTQYGFMIMDGTTRYYYTLASNGSITVYERDPEAAGANEYGFVVTKDIGIIGADTIEFKDATYINNDGYNIIFERDAATKDDYPISATDSSGTAIKGPFKKLSFQPTGEAEFSVTGAIEIGYTNADGAAATFSAQCTVVREQAEETEGYLLYVMIGYYRFEIEVNYKGDTGNTYTVNSMKYMRTLLSDRYLNNLYLIYMLYGSSYANAYPNTFGQFTLVQEFDTQGEMTRNYLQIAFGADENIRQADGTLITKVEGEYELNETSGIYSISLQAEDNYTYHFYIGITVNPYFRQYSYILYACTRFQTFESNGYTVEVERIVATDSSALEAGDIWDIKLKQGTEEIALESIYLVEDKIYCISRTRDHLETDEDGVNSGKITKTVYYELVFVEDKPSVEDGSDESQDTGTSVAVYASVTVTKHDAKTVYCADGVSYVDIYREENQVVGFVFGSAQYFVKESKYDDASKTYTVTTIGDAKYTIKIETKTDGTEEATIALIPEE